MHLSRIKIVFVLCIAFAGGFFFTACKRTESKTDSKTESAEQASPLDPSNPEGFPAVGAMRLSPEQVVTTLRQSLGLSMTWQSEDGREVDVLLAEYGVFLGGIDFQSTFTRDPSSKIHTLLTVRLLAWQGAEYVVWQDLTKIDQGAAAAELKLFTKEFLVWSMVPGASPEQEQAWRAQLERIYWTLLARAPNAEEIALQRSVFLSQLSLENAGVAWVSAIYALLAGAEFWNLWGQS